MKIYKFKAEIIRFELQNAAFIEFPFNVEEEFGVKGQVKVKASFDGVEYRGSLAKMGHHCHCLGITQEIRKQINKSFGEIVEIELIKDDEPRTVEVPNELIQIFDVYPDIADFFNSLSYSHKKEYVRWIDSAKKAETRTKRLSQAIELLKEKVKTPDEKR